MQEFKNIFCIKLIVLALLVTCIFADYDYERGDCIPEQSPCENAISNCCNPAEWACRWTEELGYRCYERFPVFGKGSGAKACIPRGDICSPKHNDKCCDDGRCKVFSNGVKCTDRGGPYKQGRRGKNCKRTQAPLKR